MANFFKEYAKKLKNPKATKLGLISAGLSLMESSGKTYDKPVSGLSLAGTAGKTGLGVYTDVLEKEQSAKIKREELKATADLQESKLSSLYDISKMESAEKKTLSEAEWKARERIHGEEETGRKARHEAEWGVGGVRERLSTAGRLSSAVSWKAKEDILKEYDVSAAPLFEPYKVENELPQWANVLNAKARAQAIYDPEGALVTAYRGVEEQKKKEKTAARIDEMTLEEAEEYRRRLLMTPEQLAAEDKIKAKTERAIKRKKRIAKLRADYEEETRAPIIGEDTYKRLSEAWKIRKKAPAISYPGFIR